jgi:hypothetical protein
MQLSGIDEAIRLAEQRWTGLQFKRKTASEACSPCPFCGGDDRFLLWDNGHWMCRPGAGHCGQTGWIDDDQDNRLTEDEKRLRRIEAEQKRLAVQQEQMARRLTVLERLNKERPDLAYFQNLTTDYEAVEYWRRQGMTDELIVEYQLGVCPICPTDKEGRRSYTIPVLDATGEVLKNVRHRIANAPNGDKYRPQAAGLGNQLFNSRWVIQGGDVALVEGEKKSIIVTDRFIPSAGVFGCKGFDMAWLSNFDAVRRLFIAFDPDALKSAWMLGYDIKAAKPMIEVRIVTLPVKPDDFFVDYGGTSRQMAEYFKMSREVHYASKTTKQR